MSFPVMPFMKKVDDIPIMSFQTDKNGTFNPVITPASGTLIWEVDGVQQTTNTPSYALTGATVDVKVFANDVPIDENISISIASQNIIGELDFTWATINGQLLVNTNADLTTIIFSSNANVSTITRTRSCNFTELDFSNVQLNGQLSIRDTPNLTTVIFGSFANTTTLFEAQNCNLSALDLSDFVTMNGVLKFESNINCASFTQPQGGTVSQFTCQGNNLSGTLDIDNLLLSGSFTCNGNSISSINFNPAAQTLNNIFHAQDNSLTSLDISQFSNLTRIRIYNNTPLVNYTPPVSYVSTMTEYRADNCALNVTSVDAVFSTLNTHYSSNAPTANLAVRTDLGTNASPTGGSSNTDLVNLRDVVYPNAGFTFTATIN